MESLEVARTARDFLRENKGRNIVLLDISDHLWITDYFVLVTGRSEPHIEFLQNELESELKDEYDLQPSTTEGKGEQGWLLTDYGNVIIHFFTEEQREYYDLEGLWADAEVVSA